MTPVAQAGGTPAVHKAPRLPARTFYGVILAGLLLGVALAVGGALAYLHGDRKPDARRIWGDVADALVVPVAVMVGGTFGALGGLAAAVAWDRRKSLRR